MEELSKLQSFLEGFAEKLNMESEAAQANFQSREGALQALGVVSNFVSELAAQYDEEEAAPKIITSD